MIRHLVFDLGGVVFRWQPAVLLQQVLPERAPDAQAAAHWVAQVFQGFAPGSDWALFDLGQIEPGPLAERIARRTGLERDEVARLIDGIPPHLTVQSETVDLIHTLADQGCSLYYLSNMPAPFADRLLAVHGFFGRFVDGVFSARVGQIKPERPIFETASQRFGVPAAQTVFIDDVAHNVDAARAHGWHGLQFIDPAQCTGALRELGVLRG